jgi:hypothetical protein
MARYSPPQAYWYERRRQRKRLAVTVTPPADLTFAYRTGDQTANITVTSSGVMNGTPENLVNGNLTQTTNFFNAVTLNGTQWLQFDFGSPIPVNEARYYDSGPDVSQGTWKCQASNDASTWTDIGTSFNLIGRGVTPPPEFGPITKQNSNTTADRYYRLLGLSGSTNGGPWVFQFDFKVGT